MDLQPLTKNGEMILYIFREVWRGVHPSSMLGRWEQPGQVPEVPKIKPKARRKKEKDTVRVAEMLSDFADLL